MAWLKLTEHIEHLARLNPTAHAPCWLSSTTTRTEVQSWPLQGRRTVSHMRAVIFLSRKTCQSRSETRDGLTMTSVVNSFREVSVLWCATLLTSVSILMGLTTPSILHKMPRRIWTDWTNIRQPQRVTLYELLGWALRLIIIVGKYLERQVK